MGARNEPPYAIGARPRRSPSCGATACASALEIGAAAVRGESRGRAMSWKGKEAIGLAVAIALTRRGILRGNPRKSIKIVAPVHSRGAVEPSSIGRYLGDRTESGQPGKP